MSDRGQNHNSSGTPGSLPQESVEDRPNVGTVAPKDYPEAQANDASGSEGLAGHDDESGTGKRDRSRTKGSSDPKDQQSTCGAEAGESAKSGMSSSEMQDQGMGEDESPPE